MVINHLEKLFVTSDAATIIRELEVVHPAGKVLVMASQQQEHEVRLQTIPPPVSWKKQLATSAFGDPGARFFQSLFEEQPASDENLLLTSTFNPR